MHFFRFCAKEGLHRWLYRAQQRQRQQLENQAQHSTFATNCQNSMEHLQGNLNFFLLSLSFAMRAKIHNLYMQGL